MKIIFVVGARGIPDVEGGVEKNTENLFPRLAARGWMITVAGLNTHMKSGSYRGVHRWRTSTARIFKTDKLVHYIHAILHAVRRRPDIVHLAGLGAAIFLIFYKFLGCKTVVRYGSADYLVKKWGPIGRIGFRLCEYQLRYADAIIAVTPSLERRLRSNGIKSPIYVIGNAIDDSFGSMTVDTPKISGRYILAVGRVTHQKNYHHLIDGFKKFSDNNPGIKLIIAGGIDDQKYGKRIKAMCDDRITMLGSLKGNIHLLLQSTR